MSTRARGAHGRGRLKVVPKPRSGWVVVNHREAVVSEHHSATEAQQAAATSLRDGDQLIVYDRYHRCHTVRG